MKIIPNTENRLYLTIDKKVYNSKKKKYLNVNSGTLRTRVNKVNIVCSIDILHRLLYPESYSFSKKYWKDINGYDGIYQINSDGQILSLNTNKVLKPHSDKDGYLLINLYKHKVSKSFKVHRLVADHFIDTEKKETVNHKDGNKKNNKVDNLEWASRSENNKHAFDNGLKTQKADYLKKTVMITKGEISMFFESVKDCSVYLNCDNSFVAKVARGKQKTCKGYEIKYITN